MFDTSRRGTWKYFIGAWSPLKFKQPPNVFVAYCCVWPNDSCGHTQAMSRTAPGRRVPRTSGRTSVEPCWRRDNGINADKNRPVRCRIAPNTVTPV